MSLQKIGNSLIATDKVLVMRPQVGLPENAVEVVFENGESVRLAVEDPRSAIDAYFSAVTGATTAPRST